MIFGFSTYGNNDQHGTFIRRLTDEMDTGELILHRISSSVFTGGFLTHPGLPYTPEDYYFSDDAGGVTVLMSGVIYNRDELAGSPGYSTGAADPALVASLYKAGGNGFASALNGDFFICIINSNKQEVLLVRDQLGIRPAAWTTTGQTMLFSSDPVALSRAVSSGEPVDTDYITGRFRYIDYRKTADARVKKLLPGQSLLFSRGAVKLLNYWTPEAATTDRSMSYDTMISDLKALLNDAVKIRCDRRFTAGAHVSSGLDSGVVSALARREYAQQALFYGYSWSPATYNPGPVSHDERDIIRAHCSREGITPVFSEMDRDLFGRTVSHYYDNKGYFDEELTQQQARERGTNLIMSGWGGDEFISTADRGIETDLLTRLRLTEYFRRNPVIPLKRFVKYFFRYTLFPALGILEKSITKSFRDDARYLKKKYRRSDRQAIRNFYFHSSRRRMHLGMLRFYHLQERTESWALSAFRRGIEYRYPLLDRRIVEYVLRIPSLLMCRTEHYRPLLRVISEGLVADEVWQNLNKKDPVYAEHREQLFAGMAEDLISESEEWRKNAGMHWADFDRLAKDIESYREKGDDEENYPLLRGLVYLRAAYAFISEYRSLPGRAS